MLALLVAVSLGADPVFTVRAAPMFVVSVTTQKPDAPPGKEWVCDGKSCRLVHVNPPLATSGNTFQIQAAPPRRRTARWFRKNYFFCRFQSRRLFRRFR